jgi:hypothetical protein
MRKKQEFLFVRWDKKSFWIIPFERKGRSEKKTEQQSIQAVIKQVTCLVRDMSFIDENRKPMSTQTTTRRIVEHAAVNCKFWFIEKFGSSFDLEEFQDFCTNGPGFTDAVHAAKRDLEWSEDHS